MSPSAQLDATFAALADPTRRAILMQLSKGDRTVTELAKPFDMSLPAISKHLKVLEHAGLVTRGRDAQTRPCTLNPKPLQRAAKWAEHYARVWDERFDRLDAYLAEVQKTNSLAGKNSLGKSLLVSLAGKKEEE
jgi:DNA-binding transcriptional ArsR family regulator